MRSRRRGGSAFTLVEVMLALAIFSMAVAAMYGTWTAILRAARVGNDAAASVQRSRIASRTLHDALLSTVMFEANGGLYAFEADTSGEFAALSFVARLPAGFIGSGYFGDQRVRRVMFTVEPDNTGASSLVLRQMPLLQTNFTPDEVHSTVLAREVTSFLIEFWNLREGWVPEWRLTNRPPQQVRFQLAFGLPASSGEINKDLTIRTVSLPGSVVGREVQLPRGPARAPVPPAAAPPGARPDNAASP